MTETITAPVPAENRSRHTHPGSYHDSHAYPHGHRDHGVSELEHTHGPGPKYAPRVNGTNRAPERTTRETPRVNGTTRASERTVRERRQETTGSARTTARAPEGNPDEVEQVDAEEEETVPLYHWHRHPEARSVQGHEHWRGDCLHDHGPSGELVLLSDDENQDEDEKDEDEKDKD